MSDVDVLESVLAKDEALVAAVGGAQLSAPTPCPNYTVHDLVNHIVRWVKVFDVQRQRADLRHRDGTGRER